MAPRTRKTTFLALGVTVAGLAVAVFAGSVPDRIRKSPPTDDGLRTVVVRSGTLNRTVRVTGSTAAAEGVMLRAPYLRGNRSRGTPGDWTLELTQLTPPGTHVREGDPVAVFDNESMRNRLDNDQADVDEAQGVLNRLRADQAAAMEAHLQKIRVARAAVDTAILDLKTAPVRSAIDAQKFTLALEEAKATVAALEAETPNLRAGQAAQLRSAELELERATLDARRAKTNLDNLTVKAPIAGLVVAQDTYRFGQFGQIRQGDQLRSGQPYVRIADLSRMVVEALANQVDATELRIGQPVTIRFDAFPDLALPGRVDGVGAMARNSGGRTSYVAEIPVKISLDKTDPRVVPDLTVSGDVQVASAEDAPIIPLESVFQDSATGRSYAYVRTPDGWERRELELDLSDNLRVAVRSGVLEGETVALDQPAQWRAGRVPQTTSVKPRTPASGG